jgi:hypothetical protein
MPNAAALRCLASHTCAAMLLRGAVAGGNRVRRCTAHTVAAAAAVFVVLGCMPLSVGAHDTVTRPQRVLPAAVVSAPVAAAPAAVPPMEPFSPVPGVHFGDGIDAGPVLAVLDVAGLIALGYVVRRRWLSPVERP